MEEKKYQKCQKCREEKVAKITSGKKKPVSRTIDTFDFDLCQSCRDSLPKCDSCGMVMGREWGYREGKTRTLGKYEICDGCNQEIKKKHFLHISDLQYLLDDGSVVYTAYVRGEPLILKLVESHYG